jgi:hypothetical protein
MNVQLVFPPHLLMGDKTLFSINVKKPMWASRYLKNAKSKLDSLFLNRGFYFYKYDEVDIHVPEWRKKCFSGHFLSVSLVPDSKAFARKRLSFSIFLSVISERQMDFELNIGIARVSEAHAHDGVAILGVDLNWLMATWPPALNSFSDALLRWENASLEYINELIEDVFFFFDRQGLDFFGKIDSPDKLISLLINFDDFVGKGGSGPVSQYPLLYASLLQFQKGDEEAAIRSVDLAENHFRNKFLLKKISRKHFEKLNLLTDSYKAAFKRIKGCEG